MKKYLLLITCSFLAVQVVSALTADEQLSNMKDMFVKEFHKMDTDKDGKINQDEYLAYQFETFRANIITADGFDSPATDKETTTQTAPAENIDEDITNAVLTETTVATEATKEIKSDDEDIVLGGASSALQDMANYKLEDFYDEDDKATNTLTKEDVFPDDLSLLTDDLVTTATETETETVPQVEAESDILKEASKDAEITANEVSDIKEEAAEVSREEQINSMITTIRQTLPKKIDEVTSWTDIQYNDNTISYIYTAEIDVSEYSPAEYTELTENIQKEACVKATTDMCPKIKPMFIEHGINMKIKYLDKKSTQIGECIFNTKTCQ